MSKGKWVESGIAWFWVSPTDNHWFDQLTSFYFSIDGEKTEQLIQLTNPNPFQEKDVGAELLRGGTEESPNVKLCSRPCLSAFVFANSVDALQCDLCRKDYDLKANPDIMAGKQVRRF